MKQLLKGVQLTKDLVDDDKHPPLSVNFAEGHARVDAADYAHEAYLFNKTWPAI